MTVEILKVLAEECNVRKIWTQNQTQRKGLALPPVRQSLAHSPNVLVR